MAISISTTMFPYRMVLSRKKPTELKVNLVNRGEKNAMITLQVLLSRQLSLDKSGLNTGVVKRIDKFSPNKQESFVFDIYPKGYVEAGNYPVVVKVMEHYQQFQFVEKEYTKKLEITVED